VKHGEQLASSYGQLTEVLVEVGDKVDPEEPLGKSGRSFAFQLLGADGPLNPESIFE
jgi:murein DD-endopeptidase MepM/ murein hydrolase activator NlpD